MEITNIHNLPDVFLNYAVSKKYSKEGADFSATQLIDSPRISALTHKHRDELIVDVSQRVFAMFGTAMHHIIETAASFDHISEERLFWTYEVDGKKYVVSGQIDLQEPYERPDAFHGGIHIVDYKVTSAWVVRLGSNSVLDKFFDQMIIYAHLIYCNKGIWPEASICILFRDWRKAETIKKGYPQLPIMQFGVPQRKLSGPSFVEHYIKGRIRLHVAAQRAVANGDEPEFCTPEERWTRPGKWAIHKPGAKKARKLFDTKLEATDWIGGRPRVAATAFEIKHREDVHIRCENYCPVRGFCNQLKAEKLTRIVLGKEELEETDA